MVLGMRGAGNAAQAGLESTDEGPACLSSEGRERSFDFAQDDIPAWVY